MYCDFNVCKSKKFLNSHINNVGDKWKYTVLFITLSMKLYNINKW